MAWFLLFVAGLCEMVWPLGFKFTNGFKEKYWAVGLTFAVMGLSLWLMSLATSKGIPIGTAYAVWTGLGASGTVILGMIYFGEPRDWTRLTCLSLIIVGVVGLKFLSPPEDAKPAHTAPAASNP
jgi:quaternary ammonium compound-resistance protein SugE